jgi:hypothetical protein
MDVKGRRVEKELDLASWVCYYNFLVELQLDANLLRLRDRSDLSKASNVF